MGGTGNNTDTKYYYILSYYVNVLMYITPYSNHYVLDKPPIHFLVAPIVAKCLMLLEPPKSRALSLILPSRMPTLHSFEMRRSVPLRFDIKLSEHEPANPYYILLLLLLYIFTVHIFHLSVWNFAPIV